MKTKPRGIHANFTTTCHSCRGDLTVSNGRIEHHECRDRVDLTKWQDALTDYFDGRDIGTPAALQKLEDIKFT
jgi:hypothetical protein